MMELIVALGLLCAFIAGAMFGVEYQKLRVQRYWRANNAKLRAVLDTPGKEDRKAGAEDRNPPAA